MIDFSKSKSNLLSATVNGIRLHSMYDPRKEAQRFLQENLKNERPNVVIILGEALGYISEELNNRYDSVKVVGIFFAEELKNACLNHHATSWYPECGSSLFDFLSGAISEYELSGLRLLVWEPSFKAYPKIAAEAQSIVSQWVLERNGNLVTTAAFGRRWITNSIRNFLFIRSFESLESTQSPIVIAASGPSLRRSIALLKKLRKSVRIWALPSSLTALIEEDIIPDLVVLTDPGFYSIFHLMPVIRSEGPMIAMPLSATSIAHKTGGRTCLISQSTFFEIDLIQKLHLPFCTVKPNGTVAGTALEMALSSGSPVIFAGLDLCYQDIHDHARPHAFDSLIENDSNRLFPSHSGRFSRLAELVPVNSRIANGVPLSLKTYAGWFSRMLGRKPNQVYRLYPSSVQIDCLPKISAGELTAMCVEHRPSDGRRETGPASTSPTAALSPPLSERKAAAADFIASWQSQLEHCAERVESTRNAETMLGRGKAAQLLYFTATRDMITFHKKAKSSDGENGVSILQNAIEDSLRYLSHLRQIIKKA